MRYRKKKQQSGFLGATITLIGRGLWFLISWPFKKLFKIGGPEKFNKARNLTRWLEIEKLFESGDEIHAAQAVIKADKFFDTQLKHSGAQGETFADRLRDYENHFNPNTYQLIWQAHKLRNQITHDIDHKPNINDCKSALNKLRRGLENLGAM